MTPDSSLAHLYPAFRARIERLIAAVAHYCEKHEPSYAPHVYETYRSVARQMELYAIGRTVKGANASRATPMGRRVTDKNGETSRSRHQSSLAADIIFKHNGLLTWDAPEALWAYFGHCARAEGLTWGGGWTGLVDKPHVEWPSSDTATYAKAADWQAGRGL